ARGSVPPVPAIALIVRAPRPQGFELAVRSRAEDLSFTATLLAVWGGVAAAVAPLGRRSRTADLRSFVLVASTVAALLVVYPRSDFMHLVTALPLAALLGALLVH